MKIGILDADLLDTSRKSRFPNLACMKMSGFYKEQGHDVELVTSYERMPEYDHVYASKVFSDTLFPDPTPENVSVGGTGFFGKDASPLPHEIEHHMPDYSLYDGYPIPKADSRFYTDYSIGFLTRGCFRKCAFCVNQKYDRSEQHSHLDEFYDPYRKKLCFIDDNFLACGSWERILLEVLDTGKRYRFMQGLDERLLTDRKCELLFNGQYDGTPKFAFDDWRDVDIIKRKAEMIRKWTDCVPVFYVLVAFDRSGRYDEEFWRRDLAETFARIDVLREYGFLPYIMRYEKYQESPFRGIYIQLARWCNQPSFFKKASFYDYIHRSDNAKAPLRYWNEFIKVNDFVPESSLHAEWKYRQTNRR